MALERLVLRGVVDSEVRPAALLADERALSGQAGQEMGRGSESLESGGVADEAAVAPQRSAQLGARGLELLGRIGCRQLRRKPGLHEGGEGRAAPEDQALEQRVRGEPVRSVHAGGGALAGGVQAGELAPPLEVGDDPAHRVVRRGRDRDRPLGRVVAVFRESPHEPRESSAVDLAQVEERGTARRDLASDDVARRELVREALPALVEQRRALAAQRFGEQERGVDERRRMELRELEVGDRRSGFVGDGDSVTYRSGRVRRPLPERRGASRRDEGRGGRRAAECP